MSNPYLAPETPDFLTTLVTDGGKFLRVADDVHTLMGLIETMASCLYLLTIGVYIGIMLYIMFTCYRERRLGNEVDQNLSAELELGNINSQSQPQQPPQLNNHINSQLPPQQQHQPQASQPSTAGVGVRGNRKLAYRRHLSSASLMSGGDSSAKQKEALGTRASNQQATAPLLPPPQASQQANQAFVPGPGSVPRRANRFQTVVAQTTQANNQDLVFDPQQTNRLDESPEEDVMNTDPHQTNFVSV